ncbi:hypothetical protein SLA2020_323910 [Shorea laevis]
MSAPANGVPSEGLIVHNIGTGAGGRNTGKASGSFNDNKKEGEICIVPPAVQVSATTPPVKATLNLGTGPGAHNEGKNSGSINGNQGKVYLGTAPLLKIDLPTK